ncbi:hypothetical protein [Paenibacillus sp. FJAT-26967]|uniref:hypothetical protein n=1 Tax=Paenibacillus sp. FJAT-26967 TaxID=1729690 RepID=UPI00083807F5|nr:hypothetical protein [Paenibacillus sp. FJAT-26967]
MAVDDKKTFYVSVGAGEIVDEPGEINFDFEIRATSEEIDKLAELFEVLEESDNKTHFRALLPFKEYHKDKENDEYDYELKEIYQTLYNLGTEETRQHIEKMNVLQ